MISLTNIIKEITRLKSVFQKGAALKFSDLHELLDLINAVSSSVYSAAGLVEGDAHPDFPEIPFVENYVTIEEVQAMIDAAILEVNSITIVDNLYEGGSDKVLSAEQGKVLKGYIDALTLRIQALEDADYITIDDLPDFNTFVLDTDVYNALDYTSAGKVLDARQGKELNDDIIALADLVDDKQNLSEKNQALGYPGLNSISQVTAAGLKTPLGTGDDVLMADGTYLSKEALVAGAGSGGLERFLFKYSNDISEDNPTTGKFRMNSLSANTVNEIYLNAYTDDNGFDMSGMLNNMDGKWMIYVQQTNEAGRFIQFQLSDDPLAVIDNGGWFTIKVDYIQSGTPGMPQNNLKCSFVFVNQNSPDDILTQEITGGDVTHAPSSDAVNTGLGEILTAANLYTDIKTASSNEIIVDTIDPIAPPSTGQDMFIRTDTSQYWFANGGLWIGPYETVDLAKKAYWDAKQEALGFTPEDVSNKENTTLDNSTDKYPTNNLVKTYVDATVTGAIILQGDWNALTNTPDIETITTTNGHAWRVSVAGTTDVGGITDWGENDVAVKVATGWIKIDNASVTAIWGNIVGDITNQTDLQTALGYKLDKNVAIVAGTKAKITYDSKGLVISGADLPHNETTGIQGGATNDYYHLTASQLSRILPLIYQNSVSSISNLTALAERGASTTVSIRYNMDTNDDVFTAASIDNGVGSVLANINLGNVDVTAGTFTATTTFTLAMTYLRNAVSTSENKTATFTTAIPKWSNVSTVAVINTYALCNTNLGTKIIATSTAMNNTGSAAGQYIWFITTNSSGVITDGNNFVQSIGVLNAAEDGVSEFYKKSFSMTLLDSTVVTMYSYRSRTLKTFSGNIYKIT